MRSRVLHAATKLPALPSVFRPRDLDTPERSRSKLRAMLRTGEVTRIGHGLYRYHAVEVTELETVATVCARAPNVIVCLITALVIHDIGTQLSSDVWIALDRKARKPRFDDLPVRVVRFSGPMLRFGVTTRSSQGVTISITNPARTVVDCFRYRNKLGIDVALEALRDSINRRLTTVDDLVRTAQACRIYTVMEPYLQAMLA